MIYGVSDPPKQAGWFMYMSELAASGYGSIFIGAASFVAHFIRSGFMVNNDGAWHQITKPLIMHDYPDENQPRNISGRPEHRVIGILAQYRIFKVVGDSLVQASAVPVALKNASGR